MYYSLRIRRPIGNNTKWDRRAKRNIDYHLMSESSIDDDSDISVRPGKWISKRSKDKYLPAKGLSKARIAAQEIIAAQRQKEAAKALISLFHTNMTTSDNSDESLSGASRSSQTTSSDNEGIVPSDTLVNKTVPKNPVAPKTL